jgi:hypothetical protein
MLALAPIDPESIFAQVEDKTFQHKRGTCDRYLAKAVFEWFLKRMSKSFMDRLAWHMCAYLCDEFYPLQHYLLGSPNLKYLTTQPK